MEALPVAGVTIAGQYQNNNLILIINFLSWQKKTILKNMAARIIHALL